MSRERLLHAAAWGLAFLALAVGPLLAFFEPVLAIGLAVTFGLATFATSVIETRARGIRATGGSTAVTMQGRPTDRRVALTATVISGVLLVAGAVQAVYARGVAEKRSIESGMEAVSRALEPEQLAFIIFAAFALGGIFGVATTIRLQRQGLWRRSSFGLVAAVIFPPIGVPLLALILTGQLADRIVAARPEKIE